jgi:hypothetical protein
MKRVVLTDLDQQHAHEEPIETYPKNLHKVELRSLLEYSTRGTQIP